MPQCGAYIAQVVARALLFGAILAFFAASPACAVQQPRVHRFDASDEAREGALPSVSFEMPQEREELGSPPPGQQVARPAFSQSEGRQIARIEIEPGTSLYGTGETPGQLMRNGRQTLVWNFDAYGYDNDQPNLYQAHPWVLAVRKDGSSFGVLADTTYEVEIDLTSGIEFRADGPEFPVITIEANHPADVVKKLADLTGKIPLPPKWALGYHQCRYSYYPDSRVREIAREFREREIPCDVIWMDIDYMDGFRCFTFDPEHFPDPAALNDHLHDNNFKSIWMIDPGIKDEDGYWVHDSGDEVDAWVKTKDGNWYNGEVWPGVCVFPDYTNAAIRAWWADLYEDFLATGIDGVWNDMNEPAVFNVATKTMPRDNVHRADPELGGEGPHARYHNIYGMQMFRATREGIQALRPDKRPFVLSRANFIGGQRYAATWTGDNSADWFHLESSVPMILNLGLSGSPFTGPDIGGFAGNGPKGSEGPFLARWMGVGAMLPFARGHTGKGNIDKEPWAFDESVERTSRLALERRYRLLPYIYTLFREAAETGMPVARPLFFVDPADPALRSEDDAFLLGGDILVACKMTPDRKREVAMPSGMWRPFDFGDGHDPDLPQLFLRGGAIVPSGPIMQYVDEKPLDTVTLLIALDDNGKAVGHLYEDDGDGYGYRDGDFLLSRYEAERVGDQVNVTVKTIAGNRDRPARNVVVRLLLDGREVMGAGAEGQTIVIR